MLHTWYNLGFSCGQLERTHLISAVGLPFQLKAEEGKPIQLMAHKRLDSHGFAFFMALEVKERIEIRFWRCRKPLT
jgi:hypothetical protein